MNILNNKKNSISESRITSKRELINVQSKYKDSLIIVGFVIATMPIIFPQLMPLEWQLSATRVAGGIMLVASFMKKVNDKNEKRGQ